MRFLLDTNVVAEPARPAPAPGVVDWLQAQPSLSLAISVLTLGEISKGIRMLAPGKRRSALETWLSEELATRFGNRVLPIDENIALIWARLAAEARDRGRPLPVVDGLLLATASRFDLVFVTRNERDCADRGVEILNPWSGSG